MNAEDVKPLTKGNQIATKIENIRELLYVGIECNKNQDITGTEVILGTVTEYLLTDLEGCVIEANLLADKNGKIGALLQVAIECNDNDDRFSTKDILETVTEYVLTNLK